ncbi:MAG TPA: TlpA disulfide reductase family protein [Chloroflexota bacterium]|jgi:cytochrome c biogenesis protein CcmG/thiol:disulfide interchange protein DsbE
MAAAVDPAEPSRSSSRRRVAAPLTGRRLIVASASILALGLLAVLGLALVRQGATPTAGFGVNQVGMPSAFRERPAPVFALTGFDGKPVQLADLRGQIVVVNFWASWCPPCREEAPVLERAWRAYRDRGVVLVGLAIWDREPNSRAFLREFAASYPSAPDPSGEAAIAYGIRGLPETIVVDRAGQIARKWIGPIGERDLDAMLGPLLQ